MGESHCIFLMGDGTLWGVGSNEYGQLGFPIYDERRGTESIDNTSIIEEMKQIPLKGFNLQKT